MSFLSAVRFSQRTKFLHNYHTMCGLFQEQHTKYRKNFYKNVLIEKRYYEKEGQWMKKRKSYNLKEISEIIAKITKIEVQKNNNQKANLFLDEVFFSRIYLDTCVKYGLKSGLEIEEDKLKQIIHESEKKLAVNFAVNYIGSAIKTRKQIRDYLKKKEFDAESIEYVVSKLEEYKYIDDEACVASYVNFYSSKYGKNKIIINNVI